MADFVAQHANSAKAAAGDTVRVQQEENFWERAAQEERLRAMTVANNQLVQDMELRRTYAAKAFGLAEWAVWFWCAMFTAVGIANAALGKPILSDTGLITLTSGATVNVIAICVIVVRGLFPQPAAK